MASHPKHFYTPQEYLALERKAVCKNEYYAGEIFAMSGASREHNLIVANVTTLLNTQLKDRNCEVYPNDMRVRTPDTLLYTYPDVVVVRGEHEQRVVEGEEMVEEAVVQRLRIAGRQIGTAGRAEEERVARADAIG